MKFRKLWITIILLFIISLFGWNFLREKIYVSDSDFIMHQNILSPDGKHRIIEFEINLSVSASRWGTAITPPEFQDLNLVSYKIPDCYETFGWTDANELITSVENSQNSMPCNSANQYQLKTGDIVQGVKVQVVNADELLLKQGIKREMTIPPPEPTR